MMELFSEQDVLEFAPPEWLIRGMFFDGSLVVLSGEPKSGKTFIALDWAMHVARGLPWMGYWSVRRDVLYIAAEGRGNFGRRLGAWREANPEAVGGSIQFAFTAVSLNDPEDVISKGLMPIAASLVQPFIVIDTLARCNSGDENSAQEMSKVVKTCDELREQHGATVLLIHHTGKTENSTFRGSSALHGAVDTLMLVKKDDQGTMQLSCIAQKDAAEFDPQYYSLTTLASSVVLTAASTTIELDEEDIRPRGRRRR